MDLNKRFKTLLAQAEQKWGRGAQSRIAKITERTPASVSAWKENGYTGSKLQLDAISEELGNTRYIEKPPQEMIINEGESQESLKGRIKAAWREAFDQFTAPIIAYAQGGEGAYPEDLGQAVPRIAVPCKDPNCYVLALEGKSMEPIYQEGDLLVVAPNFEPMNNDLVIVKTVDGEVNFKKLKIPIKGEIFQFHSFNPNHPPIHLAAEQIHRISVVHSVIRPLKEHVKAMTVSESAIL
jgi:phage repressor protein C with HTH and peptisase S24 domain